MLKTLSGGVAAIRTYACLRYMPSAHRYLHDASIFEYNSFLIASRVREKIINT
jgi:hypothetical protein